MTPLSAFLLATTLAIPEQQNANPGYPKATLRSPILTASLYLPDSTNGYYRGTRFDWSGLVSRVEWGGHTFFCDFKREHDPLNHDDICGTAEEFGIESAPSYALAKPGEPFIKIGIGILERADNSDYAFWKRYRVLQPGEWNLGMTRNRITFQQSLQAPAGWAYEFVKVVEVSDSAPELKIRRRLKNTGTQTIDTDHYDHNFLRIDNVPAGTNYTLDFRFAPHFGKDSKTQGCVEIRNRSLCFTKAPAPDQGIWLRLEGFGALADNWVKVMDHSTGTAMTITTDRPLSKLVFYSSGGVLCPEAFVKVKLAPGETLQWTTTYRFEANTAK
ncbi:MAG TPA: hypothetical protein VL793_03695 [Patescibacteria group bacterium]|nr:hypothetical protein [Patescibacteria group bacterium]